MKHAEMLEFVQKHMPGLTENGEELNEFSLHPLLVGSFRGAMLAWLKVEGIENPYDALGLCTGGLDDCRAVLIFSDYEHFTLYSCDSEGQLKFIAEV